MASLSILNELSRGRLRTVVISGTVKNSLAAGLSRRVICYRNGIETEVHASTVSAADGTYSLAVNGGPNERFRILAIGDPENAENSKLFDFVRESA